MRKKHQGDGHRQADKDAYMPKIEHKWGVFFVERGHSCEAPWGSVPS